MARGQDESFTDRSLLAKPLTAKVAKIREDRKEVLSVLCATFSWPTPNLPRFGILPRNVNGVVEVEQQSLAAVDKSEAEKIVVDKCEQRPEHDVGETEITVPLLLCDHGAGR